MKFKVDDKVRVKDNIPSGAITEYAGVTGTVRFIHKDVPYPYYVGMNHSIHGCCPLPTIPFRASELELIKEEL